MTLRRAGRLYHLKVGAAFARRRVLAIVDEPRGHGRRPRHRRDPLDPPDRARQGLLAQHTTRPRPMAGVSSDRMITCVADVATHVSPMSRLMTMVGGRDSPFVTQQSLRFVMINRTPRESLPARRHEAHEGRLPARGPLAQGNAAPDGRPRRVCRSWRVRPGRGRTRGHSAEHREASPCRPACTVGPDDRAADLRRAGWRLARRPEPGADARSAL